MTTQTVRFTKKQQILGFIAEAPAGRRFGEIQRFICQLNGRDYDQFELQPDWNHPATRMPDGSDVGPWKLIRRRVQRGYYTTTLGRILYRNCKKVGKSYFIKDKSQ